MIIIAFINIMSRILLVTVFALLFMLTNIPTVNALVFGGSVGFIVSVLISISDTLKELLKK